MAQKQFQVQDEIIINVSATELWELVGPGFIDVYQWASTVDHAEGEGTARFAGAVCNKRHCDVNVQGFSKISEELTQYNQENMRLTYAVVDGMPKFITEAANTWTVVAVNEHQSKLLMNAHFEVRGLMGTLMRGMMKSKMKKTLRNVLTDAKIFAETGEVSALKAKRIQKLKKREERQAA